MLHPDPLLSAPIAARLVQDGAGQVAAPATQSGTQGAPPAGPPPGGSAFTSMLMPLLLCAVVFYLLVLGPERKQRKKREEMLKKLAKGDKVVTTGGLHATVVTVQDDVVTLQIADGVRARFSRSAVQTVLAAESGAAEKAEPKEAERAVAKR